jgi:homogentisate phytyltransferase/homogentisate geranylgeranyltransferase
MFGLSLVIAWFKDMPDITGDRKFRIMTLTLSLGPKKVFDIGRWVLTFCYLALVFVGFWGIESFNQLLLVISHIVLLLIMWIISFKIDATDKASISRYYLFIWTLFFAEYIVFPLSVLTA